MSKAQQDEQIAVENYRKVVQKLIAIAMDRLEGNSGGLILRQESGNVIVMSSEELQKYLDEKKDIPITLGDP